MTYSQQQPPKPSGQQRTLLLAAPPPPHFPELPGVSTLPELNAALLNHIIPGKPAEVPHTVLLPFREAIVLDASEVERALARSSPSLAPGPDMIPNSVWKRINRVAPSLLLGLLAPLVSHGFHAPSLKKADSIVLDNPGKPSYDSPSSFRVIVLLMTFSKILERIMKSRLSCVAQVVGLLNPYQCSSLAALSVAAACNTLTHEIRTLQMDKRKVSTLLLDIKSGFDNVNPLSLSAMLTARGVNPYLVAWIRSFLMGSSCRLLFQGSPKVVSLSLLAPGPSLAPPVCHIRFRTPEGDRIWPYTLLRGRLCPNSLVGILLLQCPAATQAVCNPERKGLTAGSRLLNHQN